MADISGTTLHSASRILTAWEKAGLLVSRNQRLTIRKPSEIQRIADEPANAHLTRLMFVPRFALAQTPGPGAWDTVWSRMAGD